MEDKVDLTKRDLLKKAMWVAPVLTIISMPESVQAVQSGWNNDLWKNGGQPAPESK